MKTPYSKYSFALSINSDLKAKHTRCSFCYSCCYFVAFGIRFEIKQTN